MWNLEERHNGLRYDKSTQLLLSRAQPDRIPTTETTNRTNNETLANLQRRTHSHRMLSNSRNIFPYMLAALIGCAVFSSTIMSSDSSFSSSELMMPTPTSGLSRGGTKVLGYMQCPPSWMGGACRLTPLSAAGINMPRPVGSVPLTFNNVKSCRSIKNDDRLRHRTKAAATSSNPSMVITGNNIELTESISAYTNDKLGHMLKKYKGIKQLTKRRVHTWF